MCQALKKHKPTAIARYIRVNRKSSGGNHFDGYVKKDREYQNVMRKIGRVKEMMAASTLNELLDSRK